MGGPNSLHNFMARSYDGMAEEIHVLTTQRDQLQSRCEELEESRSDLRDALALVHESTNDPRILSITRTALQKGGDDG